MITVKFSGVLIFLLAFFPGCNKEATPVYQASLRITIDGSVNEVEWLAVYADRPSYNQVRIDALGYNDNRFILSLDNITDSGFIPSFDISNIHYSQMLFTATAIQSGSIHISQVNDQRIRGSMDIFFHGNAGNVFRLTGSFSVAR